MPKTSKPAPVKNERVAEIMAEVTGKVIESLEAGQPAWVQPWENVGQGLPYNAATGRKYNGGNIFWLWITQMVKGYPLNGWMTFKQAKELGGMVRKGESATQVVLFKPYFKPVLDENGQPVLDDKGEPKMRMAGLQERYFSVFNVAQIDGLPERVMHPRNALAGLTEVQRHEAADAFFSALPGTVKHGGDRAYYSPVGDYIAMPESRQFRDAGAYYATLAHEYVHFTGHKSRLNRFDDEFREATGASSSYAFEELIAEMGSAVLCAELGLEGSLQHVQYLAIWAARLRESEKMLFQASSAASKAVAWLQEAAYDAMGVEHDEEAAEAPDDAPVLAVAA